MTIEILKDIISEFDTDKFIQFFRNKNRSFSPRREKLDQYNDESFKEGLKLGEIDFTDEGQNFIVCSFKSSNSLTERSGKKAQYEKAKKILKSLYFDAGVFIFYDQNGNFRFSLIYANYLGKKRDWSAFRRFTYFISSDYTNKTFYQRIGAGDFSSLEKIKDAFSVEKVTKDFYKDIANWYFWAVQNSKFPKDAEAEENGRNIVIIRLITRLIFIWFMRERKLVPKDLFDKEKIKDYLKDLGQEESTYYKAILQNLFFATLSTKQKERKFGSEKRYNKGWNEDYGNQYVFRYQELFRNPENLKEYFADIPFLNGGLFECLDDKRNGILIDGFSRTKKNQPIVPNYLFFSDEEDADLNKEYGTKKKKYKVQGLINTLSNYNFTIDENEPDDAEVALDPELLGKVFENLLASFNPETSSTARKATGSYYTPREIVDYMVTQSLKEYFKTHLEEIDKLDEKIDELFKRQEAKNPLSGNVSKKIVGLIDNLRIVDPAVGSGAFPMGILNKLTLILGRLDPDNKLWKEAQIDAVKNNITDPILRRNYLEQINEQFANKNFDYGRKLYLIQKCIYGVDIQQIAVEIAKLRFFIALLVDEKIDKSRENWGIEPLPNLDFKIMQGNSLISEFRGIDFDRDNMEKNNGQIFSDHQEVDELIGKFQQKKNEFQNEPDRNIKEKLEQEIDDLIIQIFETKLREQKADYFRRLERIKEKYAILPNKEEADKLISKEKKALSKKEGFDLEKFESQLREFSGKNKIKPFFAWKLYFAEVFQGNNPGFDIVIANPPYIKEYTQKSAFNGSRNSSYYQGKMDLWYLFACKSIDFLKNNSGIIAFIAQNNWVTSYGASILRNKIINETKIISLIDFGDYKIFESAGIQTMVMIFQKDSIEKEYYFDYRKLSGDNLKFENVISVLDRVDSSNVEYLSPKINRINFIDKKLTFSNPQIGKILNKVLSKVNFKLDPMEEVANGIHTHHGNINKKRAIILKNKFEIGTGIFILSNAEKEKMNLSDKEQEILKPLFTTKEIKKWYCNPKNKEWIIYTDSTFKTRKKIEDYPKIKNHLDQFQKVITSDNKPYGLHRSRNEYFFKGEKIISLRKCVNPTFTYTDFDCYVSATFYLIKSERINQKYLVGLLNSNLIAFWLRLKGKMQGNNFQIDKEPIIDLPIIKPSNAEQKDIICLVDQILTITKSENYLNNYEKQTEVKKLKDQIDQMVYKLYNLTPGEIDVVEGKKKQ